MRRPRSNSPLSIGMMIMILFALFVFPQQIFSQNIKSITGSVIESGQPLPGVSVKIKGVTTGVATGNDGKYSIKAKSTDVLVFSFVGMETQEIAVGEQTTINVTMKEQPAAINEVLVIGYQTVRKADLTGAVGSVKIADINKAPVSNFAEALAGRVAGVQVSSNDGQPGNTMNIQIRGASSLNNSVQPLYIIDGFATENYESANLNPDDIESINILKDAASTAVYGSRGTNGVVVITTKRGKIGRPVVSFTSSYGKQSIRRQIPLMDPYEFVKYQFERNAADATSNYLANGKTLESYRNMQGINWPGEISRTGSILKNNVALRGGNAQTKYSVSVASFDQKGVLINTGYTKYQGRATIDQTISKKFRTGFTADYMEVKAYGVQASSTPVASLSSAQWFRAWAYRPIQGSNTDYNLLESDGDPESINTSDIRLNPKISAENEYNYSSYANLTVNGYLTWDIVKHLQLKVTGIKNVLRPEQDRFYNSKTPQGSPLNPLRLNGIYGSILQTTMDIWSNENTLTYINTFNNVHHLTVVAGNSQQSSHSRAYGYTGTNLPNESEGMAGLDEGIASAPVATATGSRLSSFFGIADYNYQSKYYLKVALRADGSSKFPKQWGYFPTAGVGWNMHNEEFIKKIPFISYSKLRASYGVTGNNRIGDYDWYSTIAVNATANGAYTFNNAPTLGAYTTGIENLGLTWEKTTTKDIGYELGLFKDRIQLEVDVYDKSTTDLLISGAPLAAWTGFATATQNIGSMRNRGLEISVTTTPIKTRKFTWESNFNISFNKNKIVALARGQLQTINSPSFDVSFGDMYLAELGGPVGQMYGYVWDGNYQYADFNNPAPGVYVLKPGVPTNGAATQQPGDIKYKDLNGDGTVNSLDRTVIGRGQPIHYGGFSNNFTYKNFTMNLFFQWSYGNNVYNANRIILEGNANGRTDLNQFASYENRWSPTNQDAPNYRAGGQGQVGYFSSRTVEDGSYLRLKTASLAYSVPAKYLKRFSLSALSINVSAQNLITWTKYTGMDPEVSTRGGLGVLMPGFDFSPYPQSRTIVLGVNASF
ncbi:SusC/RagA family TonB-linked outer membrane protein [Mucilaginibacter boryungensis]